MIMEKDRFDKAKFLYDIAIANETMNDLKMLRKIKKMNEN